MHYLPFFMMERQLFIHHYLPALFYSVLLTAVVFDFVTSKLRTRLRFQLAAVVVLLAAIVYFKYSPLVYGLEWTRGDCDKARWLSRWDFACQEYPTAYSDYDGYYASLHEHTVKPANDVFEQLQSKASEGLASET